MIAYAMRFPIVIPIASTTTGADPASSPSTVDERFFAHLTAKPYPSGEAFTNKVFLALDAPTGETVTVDLWAVDESTLPGPEVVVTSTILGLRKFYQVASAVLITAKQVQELSQRIAPGAILYVRVTANTLTGNGKVLMACGS